MASVDTADSVGQPKINKVPVCGTYTRYIRPEHLNWEQYDPPQWAI